MIPRPRGVAAAWVFPAAAAALTVLPFLPSLQNSFVSWDDRFLLLDNPHFRGLGPDRLSWMFTTFHSGHYQPLSWMTYALDYRLWGLEPFGYHLTSLILHAANAVLFYFLSLRLLTAGLAAALPPRPWALAAALLFSIHPLRVESVAWASERRDVLSGFFFLATLLLHLKAVDCAKDPAGRWWRRLSVSAFLLALLSKSMAVTLPVVLVILDAYPLRRLAGPRQWLSPAARALWTEKLPYALPAAVAAGLAILAESRSNSLAAFETYGSVPRLVEALFGISFYLWKTVWPVGLSTLYDVPYLFSGRRLWLAAITAGLLALSAAALRRGRAPAILAVWAYYLATLLPVLGLIKIGPQLAADRYTYLPCLGWALLAAGAASRYGGMSRTWAVGLFALSLPVLGALTWSQCLVWRDSLSLWTQAAAVNPASPSVQKSLRGARVERHNSLGMELYARGRFEESILELLAAARLEPGSADAQNNLGLALYRAGRIREARIRFERAIALNERHSQAQSNLGIALARQGRRAAAAARFRRALELDPGNQQARESLRLTGARP